MTGAALACALALAAAAPAGDPPRPEGDPFAALRRMSRGVNAIGFIPPHESGWSTASE